MHSTTRPFSSILARKPLAVCYKKKFQLQASAPPPSLLLTGGMSCGTRMECHYNKCLMLLDLFTVTQAEHFLIQTTK